MCLSRSLRPQAKPGELWEAVSAKDEALVVELLARGADPDDVMHSSLWPGETYPDKTALNHAVFWGHQGIVGKLLGAGASGVDQALRHAAYNTGRDLAPVCSQLLAAGAAVNATDESRRTALWYAASEGQQGVVAVLLGGGADVERADVNGSTPLMAAAHCGHAQICSQLLAAGAAVNAKDSDGKTALKTAHKNCAKVLKAAGGKKK